MNNFIFQSISFFKSKTSVDLFNFLTNNNDFIYITPNLYLGNINSCQNPQLLEKNNIQCVINCTKDIEFHEYFNDKTKYRLNIVDSKDSENIDLFKSKIIDTLHFMTNQINKKNNVLVHCYWGLMRSVCVIACYMIYTYNMEVDCAIEFIRTKKNMSFHDLYNFKEILYFVKNYKNNKFKEINEKI